MKKNMLYSKAIVLLLIFTHCKTAVPDQKSASGKQADNNWEHSNHMQPSEDFFHGLGTEPFWGLELSAKGMRFHSMLEDYKEINTPLPEMIRAADANIKLYRAVTEAVSMSVEITQGDCSDNMSDNIYPYHSRVIIKKGNGETKEFQGCGYYILDDRLHDIWVLEELNGKKVSLSDFENELPRIEINTSEKSVLGYGGCNQIQGQIFGERELIRFTKMISSMKMCPGNNKEAEFLKALQSATAYEVKNLRLYLSNPNGPLLVLRKVD